MWLGRLKKRSKSQRKHASSAPPMLESPKKHLKWSDKSMAAAIKAVTNGCSIKWVALEHSVPRTTLQDWITGLVHGSTAGAKPKVEETKLAVAKIGYGKTGHGRQLFMIKSRKGKRKF